MNGLFYHPGARDITPEERLHLLNEYEWELFIEDCVRQLKNENKYTHVQLLGGAGDKGRDVCGYELNNPDENTWDLYQAKYYAQTLSPSEFLPDIAKFVYYVFNGDFTRPKNYYICALKVGTKLFDLVSNPENMRNFLTEKWIDKSGDFKTFKKPLTPELKLFIESFPFDVFKVKTPKDLLDIHSRNGSKHWERFGVLAKRGPDPKVPDNPDDMESKYILELLGVYSMEVGRDVDINILQKDYLSLHKHLKGQRMLFYCAEGLNRFSRDKLPGAYDELLNILEISISSKLYKPYSSIFDKLEAVLDKASNTKIETNPLKCRVNSIDLEGSCHHLVNRDVIKWID